MSGPISRDTIARLVRGEPPLVEGYLSLKSQLQPNGFDLTVRDVSRLETPGQIGASDDDRRLSEAKSVEADLVGWYGLKPDAYLVTFNETIRLPLDLMALGRPRSSLLRSGVALHTAVWDAGYHGRSQALLTVHHPRGFRLQTDARLLQLVFFRLETPATAGYRGRFQGENIQP